MNRFALLAALAAGASAAVAAPTTLVTSADTFINKATPVVQGAATTIVANDISTGNQRFAYVRFNLSGVTDPIQNVQLQLIERIGNSADTFNVYGLTEAADDWDEATLIWGTSAPGVDTTQNTAMPLKTADLYGGGTVLTTITTLGTNNTAKANASPVATGAVLDFIAADTDKVISFLIAEPGTGTGDAQGVGWDSREAVGSVSGAVAPTLAINVPEPTTATLLVAAAVGLVRRRRRAC